MKKRAIVAGVLAAAMMALTACSSMPGMGNAQPAGNSGDAAASSDKVYELKISTSQTEQALITRNYQKLADELNEKSGGRLKVTVFPAGQLGSDEDVLEQAIQGANVAVNTDASRMGQYVKDFSILMMGYFADNYDECYQEALRLLQRRFFCEHRQHTIGYDQLPKQDEEHIFQLTPEVLQSYCESLIGYIQAAKRNQMAEMLHELEGKLYSCDEDIPQIKLFLTDLYLSIKEKIFHLYHNADIPFPSNAEIIEFINDKYYLYEIVLFFTEQFEMIIRTIGNPSSESVMDDIIHYIEHNYMDNIKLENIAPLFGYNSSYLGKIFTKKVGQGFNVFVDKIRIEHSKDLLVNSSLKVYEIAEKVGYRNVDYFHTKFKKYVKQSPAEYRKQMRQPDMEAEH